MYAKSQPIGGLLSLPYSLENARPYAALGPVPTRRCMTTPIVFLVDRPLVDRQLAWL